MYVLRLSFIQTAVVTYPGIKVIHIQNTAKRELNQNLPFKWTRGSVKHEVPLLINLTGQKHIFDFFPEKSYQTYTYSTSVVVL